MNAHAQAIDHLAKQDARLRAEFGSMRSLCPSRNAATPLAELGESWLTAQIEPLVAQGFATALTDIVAAQAANFPDNLFWDFDFLARRLFEIARCGTRGRFDELAARRQVLISLQERFGMHSPIQFRYAHDFVYGFDWAKWVRRGGAERHAVGPFDQRFLDDTLDRGAELLELIRNDDATYPRLEQGRPRNPFGFSREPSEESRLLQDLAARGLIPVRAWDPQDRPSWDRPFAELREERARNLAALTRSHRGPAGSPAR